ncbi:MAG: tetratricopeptide repeat protein [Gammaproteobacteria bacterium]|jgi:TolA-binding protein|nr:tetratricopeptide repeat protein [Gammaproteobacteria bacterium]MBT3721931.1 tetratricopeptide repeat protein [Gammaproteobacteria bacterium]MBT4075557.1 tetratricopeptide repeat protein [Gammaproteobacteria bacterium]MBT4192973.1 tetratricopeptide repeat protein [Gammaproteobacteria bacterium]MBT4450907.1 tetratricopeptide repeat protein [Gammaproteobacteria bacterium]
MKIRLILTLTSLIIIQSCVQTADKIKPTISDLPNRASNRDLNPKVSFGEKNSQLIKSYRELVSISPQGGEYGKEVQRLADLELEASLDNKLSENPARVKQGEQEAKLAIQRYQQYLETYPDREDNDLILYQLSRAYAMQSEPEQSQIYMQQLVAQFPKSQYIDEIQFRLGENFFVEGDYARSEKAYGVIVRDHADSLYYEKSLYKYGWAQFKQNQNKNSISSFVKLLDLKQQQQFVGEFELKDSLSRAEKELVEDVLRVTSLAFSYLPARQPISQFFNTAGKRSYEPLLYRKLADLYLSKDRLTDATDVYISFGENYPFSSYTPVFHQLVINTYKKTEFTSLLLPEKETFVKKYNKDSAYWNQQTAETQAKLQPVLTSHMFDIATHYHATARVSKKSTDYKKTASWYQLYLDSFPQHSKAAEVNFLLAESRFDAKQYELAIAEYEKTAYLYPAHKNSAESGYAALIAYNKLYKISPEKQRPIIKNNLIQSSLRFTDKFPDDKRSPGVLLKTAEQFFDLKKFDQAKNTAGKLVKNPKIKQKLKHSAWILIAHSSFELAEYANAETAYAKVIAGMPVKARKRNTISEQLASSIYKQGEVERERGNHELAAQHFLRLGKIVPGSPKRIIADYDAATEYMTLKQWPTAIVLLETFRKSYPKQKKWTQSVTEKLTLAYNNSGQHAKAAGEMLSLIKLTPKDQQQDMLWQVAELYNQAGKKAKAISTYKTYIKKYPTPISRSIELRYKIAQYYQAKKESERYHFWLREIVKADAKGKRQRTDRTRYLAATSSLILIEPVRKQYSKIKLSIPLKKSLKVKKSLMKKSITAYTKAVKYQVEEVTTTATFNIAEIYREFANALLTSERPKKLNEEALEEYNYLLEDQAYPFEEKSINIHKSNLSRIPKGSFDDSIKNSLKALGKLMPFTYAKTELTDSYAE